MQFQLQYEVESSAIAKNYWRGPYLQERYQVADAWLHMPASASQDAGDLLKGGTSLVPLCTAGQTHLQPSYLLVSYVSGIKQRL